MPWIDFNNKIINTDQLSYAEYAPRSGQSPCGIYVYFDAHRIGMAEQHPENDRKCEERWKQIHDYLIALQNNR